MRESNIVEKIERGVNENTREYVYRTIKENIMFLRLIPGQSLSEIELSEKLGVTRTPVREAFVKLLDEMLIEVYPQKGTFVSKINLSAVDEAFHTRKLIENDVLRLAIELFDEEGLKELEKNLYYQKGITEFGGDTIEMFNLDNKFHQIIYEKVGRSRTWTAIKYISAHSDRIRFLTVKEMNKKTKTLEQHIEIYEAIKNKNSEQLKILIDEHLSNYVHEMKEFQKKHPEYFTLE